MASSQKSSASAKRKTGSKSATTRKPTTVKKPTARKAASSRTSSNRAGSNPSSDNQFDSQSESGNEQSNRLKEIEGQRPDPLGQRSPPRDIQQRTMPRLKSTAELLEEHKDKLGRQDRPTSPRERDEGRQQAEESAKEHMRNRRPA